MSERFMVLEQLAHEMGFEVDIEACVEIAVQLGDKYDDPSVVAAYLKKLGYQQLLAA